MRALAAEIAQAAKDSDWDRLRAATDALPGRLGKLAARGPLSAPEQQALAELRAAHEQARKAVARAGRDTQALLDEMHNNKEGWIAYALNGVAPAVDHE